MGATENKEDESFQNVGPQNQNWCQLSGLKCPILRNWGMKAYKK